MRQSNLRVSRRRLTGTLGLSRAVLERRLKDALGEVTPPPDLVGRIMATVSTSEQAPRVARKRRPLWGIAPAALTACVATFATLLFLMAADTCLAVGPGQAALAQRLSYGTTLLRFRLAELANALLRLFGAFLP